MQIISAIRGDKANYSWVIAPHVPVHFSGFSTPNWIQPGFRATAAGCAGLPGLHPSPGQSGMQSFISWLGCFLTEIKEGEMVFSQLHLPPAWALRGAHTQVRSAGITGDEPPPQLSDMARDALAAQVCLCLCCCRGVHPCNPSSLVTSPSFLCMHFGIHKRCRGMGRWQAKLSCHEGTASMKLIQELVLKTQRERWRDSRNLLTPLWASILPSECVSTCEGNLLTLKKFLKNYFKKLFNLELEHWATVPSL